MKFTLLVGSVAEHSHTAVLITVLQELIEARGHQTELWDLGKKPLPIAQPEFHTHPEDTPNDSVKEFIRTVKDSDGFVLGSPLYHGSYSGVLKNALDNLHYDAFRNKPVALVSHSSNVRNCIVPSDHLRVVVRALFGYPTQSQIGTSNDDYESLDQNNGWELTNEDIRLRCSGLIDELLALAGNLRDNPTNQRA